MPAPVELVLLALAEPLAPLEPLLPVGTLNPVLVEPAPVVAPVELVLWLLLSVVCGAGPDCAASAWASPDPLASAAPTPSVTALAPSQLGASVWRWWARRLAFFI